MVFKIHDLKAFASLLAMKPSEIIKELEDHHFAILVKEGTLILHHELFIRGSSKFMLSLINKDERFLALFIATECNRNMLFEACFDALVIEDLCHLNFFTSFTLY